MDRKYIAFISYRNVPLDAAVARSLHRQIERYVIPRALRKDRKRFGEVFRDQEEMRATHDLRQELKDALDQSEYLIVVCSPDTAGSRWVREEIEYFLLNHRPEQVFTVLAKGEPEDVIPEILRSGMDLESGKPVETIPSAVDARGDTALAACWKLRRDITKLYAGMLGCSRSKMAFRHERRIWMQALAFFAAALLVTLGFASMLLGKNLEIERQKQEIEGQNQTLEDKNRELEQQKAEIQLQESKLLTQNAWDALESGDRYAAIEYAAAALPRADGERPYYVPAEQALFAAMDFLGDDRAALISTHKTLHSDEKISDFCVSADNSKLICGDVHGKITCFDAGTGEVLWSNSYQGTYYNTELQAVCADDLGCVIVSYRHTSAAIVAFSLETGEKIWVLENDRVIQGRPMLSADQRVLICMLRDSDVYPENEGTYLAAVSTETGEILQEVSLSGLIGQYFDSPEEYFCSLRCSYVGDDRAVSLSEDNRLYAGCFAVSRDDADYLCYYVADLETGAGRIVYHRPVSENEARALYYTLADQGRKLAVIQTGETDDGFCAVVDMIDLERDKLLWSKRLPVRTSDAWEFVWEYGYEAYHQSMGDHLLVGYQDTLYLLDVETGARRSKLKLEADIALLTGVDAQTYRVVINNGDCLTGQITDGRLADPVVEYAAGMTVNNQAVVDRTILFDYIRGGAVEVKTGADGKTILALTARDEVHKIELYQHMAAEGLVNSHTITMPDDAAFYHCVYSGAAGADTTAIGKFCRSTDGGEEYFYALVDTAGYRTKETFAVGEGYNIWYPDFFMPDGSGFINGMGSYGANLFDLESGDVIQFPVGNAEYRFITATPDGQMIAADLLDDRVLIWRGDADPVFMDAPDGVTGLVFWQAAMGRNGLIVCSYYPGAETVETRYAVCDTLSETWIEFCGEETRDPHWADGWDEYPKKADTLICVGDVLPLFAVWDNENILRVYDCTTKTKYFAAYSGLVRDSVTHMQFIMDDAYLLVQTVDGLITIFDARTGAVVLREASPLAGAEYVPAVYRDPRSHRLYLVCQNDGSDTCGICIDTENWVIQARIPGMIGYDESQDMIYRMVNAADEPLRLVAYRLPGAQELVALARAFLNRE